MRIFIEPPYDGDSVDQTVRHVLNILHAAGIFLNVAGGSADGHALALVEAGDGNESPGGVQKGGNASRRRLMIWVADCGQPWKTARYGVVPASETSGEAVDSGGEVWR